MIRTLGLGLLSTLFLGAACGPGAAIDMGTPTEGGDMATSTRDMTTAAKDLSMAAGSDLGAGSDMAAAAGDMATSGDGGAQTYTVHVGTGGMFTFSPMTLTIKAGDTVKWIWDSNGHTVTSGVVAGTADNKFCSPSDMDCSMNPTSNAGATYSHKFATAGNFPYFCRPHSMSGMLGAITVQ